jgi:mannose-6-phosphate isomerase
MRSPLACIDFTQGAIGPVTLHVEATTSVRHERLFQCDHFTLWRLRGESPFTVGVVDLPRILVYIEGVAQLEHEGAVYGFARGDVLLLPAVVGACVCRPRGELMLLEIALPELP